MSDKKLSTVLEFIRNLLPDSVPWPLVMPMIKGYWSEIEKNWTELNDKVNDLDQRIKGLESRMSAMEEK